MDNNADSENAHAKASFSTYNNADSANADAGAGDTNSTRDAGVTGGADNNSDGKNAYAKANFSTYNVADANVGIGVGNAIVTREKVSSNTNNIGVGQSGKVDKTNIKTRFGLGKANKSKTGGASIETKKKAAAGDIANTDNSANGGGKVTDQCAGLTDLAFAALAAANYAGNSNLVVPEKTPLGAATSIFDEFFTIFAAFANIILERKSMMYKSNLFLFAANHQ